ncbi:MAG: SEC-C metal-binding domain-containing protein, partial [Pseudomonadota bacterium]
VADWAKEEGVADTEIIERLESAAADLAAQNAAKVGPDAMRRLEKMILLHALDNNWREHLQQLDHLRSVIWMRGHAQRDPVNEFKTEAFALFESLLNELRRDVTRMLMHVRVQEPEQAVPQRQKIPTTETHIDATTGENEMAHSEPPSGRGASAGVGTMTAMRRAQTADPNNPETWGRVSRNAPCPCGSGRKFKHCHGSI